MLTIRRYVLFLMTILAISGACAQAPYTVEVRPVDSSLTVGMHSFAWAQSGQYLLLVGGRINGFHRTSDQERTFPTKFDNVQFRVIDLDRKRMDSAAIPAPYLLPLRTTNMAFCQDGDFLYIAGGYGSKCDSSDAASCYQTFPNLTELYVPGVISQLTFGPPDNIPMWMATMTDDRMRVTGGSLEKIGDYFYLVFGQNYNSIYKGGVTGIYTEQIRRFKINRAQGKISISDYDSTVTSLKYQGLSQFHRRDLNVFPTILPDGTEGIGALGGVFTKKDGPFPHPIAISSPNGVVSTNIDTSFRQKFCLYDCARMLVYDPWGKNMYTTLFGGITDYYYDGNGKILPSDPDSNYMPFFNHLSTVGRNKAGVYTEYPQYAPALPGNIGSNAAFIPDPFIKTYKKNRFIINYFELPADTAIRVGWIFGGIKATGQQASEAYPTFANNMIYEVYLTKHKRTAEAIKTPKQTAKGKKK